MTSPKTGHFTSTFKVQQTCKRENLVPKNKLIRYAKKCDDNQTCHKCGHIIIPILKVTVKTEKQIYYYCCSYCALQDISPLFEGCVDIFNLNPSELTEYKYASR
jgi:transcription elongation factor Elf1